MSVQAGQLLISRQHLTLPDGLTTVDTGLRQVNRGVDPPLDGEDPTATTPGIASRVMVVPLSPISEWQGLQHGEPYLGPNGTVLVDFFVTVNFGPLTFNVMFWDPHTVVTPMDADVYTDFQCFPVNVGINNYQAGAGPTFAIQNLAAGNPAGVIVTHIAVRVADNFASPTSDPQPVEPGWTVVRRGSLDFGAGAGIKFACFVRPIDIADPFFWNYAWTADLSSYVISQVDIFQPVNLVTPVQADAPIVPAGPADPLPIGAPSLVAVANALLLCAFVVDQRDTDITDPIDMGPLAIIQTTDPDLPLALRTYQSAFLPAGPTGVRTAIFDDPDDDPVNGLGYSILVAPFCGIFPPS